MPERVHLTLAVGRYAITEALIDGTAAPAGTAATVLTMPSPERHWRMLRNGEFDAAEVSLAGYLQAHAQDPDRFTAVPVFPHRRFRHGYVFVPDDSPLRDLSALAGRTVGLRTWATTAGVWMRGILQDHHDVALDGVRWVTERDEHLPGGVPAGLDIAAAPEGTSGRGLLASGDLDALIYPERLTGPGIRPLLADARAEELRYHRRSGVFPIMHTVAVRRELADRHPWLPTEIANAFQTAKATALARARDPRWLPLAWADAVLDEQQAALGADPYPYGLPDNLQTLQLLIRYAAEQGLTSAPVSAEQLFWPPTRAQPPRYVRE